jgi:hypothetical protein
MGLEAFTSCNMPRWPDGRTTRADLASAVKREIVLQRFPARQKTVHRSGMALGLATS